MTKSLYSFAPIILAHRPLVVSTDSLSLDLAGDICVTGDEVES